MRRMIILLMVLSIFPTGSGWANPQAETRAAQSVIDERLLGLLPPADLVGVVDLPALLTDLLPRLEKLGVRGAPQLASEFNKILAHLGIESKQLRQATFAFSLESFAASGLVLLEGVNPDQKKIESLLRSYQIEYRTLDHQGVAIITMTNPPGAPSLGPLSINTTDLSYAALGEGRVAIGELSQLRQAIERRQKPTPAPGSQLAALRETNPTSLLRFAFNLSPAMREAASSQGDLFKSIAAVNVLFGDLQVAPDLALTLSTLMRTPSAKEAVELEQGLKGLINLGRVLLANGDPNLTTIINQVRVSIKDRDVTLRIALPASFIEQMAPRKSQP